jgi:hypothetical protein
MVLCYRPPRTSYQVYVACRRANPQLFSCICVIHDGVDPKDPLRHAYAGSPIDRPHSPTSAVLATPPPWRTGVRMEGDLTHRQIRCTANTRPPYLFFPGRVPVWDIAACSHGGESLASQSEPVTTHSRPFSDTETFLKGHLPYSGEDTLASSPPRLPVSLSQVLTWEVAP